MPDHLLPFPEALAVVLQHAAGFGTPAPPESVPLLEAAGRVLAAPVFAERDQPPFDRSTRDGYAVRAADVQPDARLWVTSSLRAGEEWTGGDLSALQAIEIMTGAPVPPGADAVLMVEHATFAPGSFMFHEGHEILVPEHIVPQPGRTLLPGANVVPRGSEARAGATVIPAGRQMGAAEIAVAASCGCATLPVHPRPRVAVLATGDELVELGQQPEPWQIRNSNSYALAALVAAHGGQPQQLPAARDTLPSLRESLALAASADLLLLSGGVSMGKYDLVEQVLADLGAEFFFTGALIQPGKPIVFGRLPRPSPPQAGCLKPQDKTGRPGSGDKAGRPGSGASDPGSQVPPRWQYFFGLPGNPVSTQVCFHLFAAPFLRALAGSNNPAPQFAEARLAEDLPAGTRVTRFLPADLTSDWQSATVRPVGWQGSGDLAANARGNCYVVLPADHPPLPQGSSVSVLLR